MVFPAGILPLFYFLIFVSEATTIRAYVSLGILQFPYYSLSIPASMNFGGGGVIMGHENTHGTTCNIDDHV